MIGCDTESNQLGFIRAKVVRKRFLVRRFFSRLEDVSHHASFHAHLSLGDTLFAAVMLVAFLAAGPAMSVAVPTSRFRKPCTFKYLCVVRLSAS